MGTIPRINTNEIEGAEVLRKLESGEWSVVRTSLTHGKTEQSAEENEMMRVCKIARMAREMAGDLEELLDELVMLNTYQEYSLRRGRINAYTGVLSDLVNRL
jgi:hypothetical protein